MRKLLRAPLLRHPEILILLVVAWLLATANLRFWALVSHSSEVSTPLALMQAGALAFALCTLLLLLTAIGPLTRPVLALVLVSSAAIAFFMRQYGIVFDDVMLVNVLETNHSEALELASPAILVTLLLLGVIPAVAILCYPLTRRTRSTALVVRCTAIGVCLAVIAGCLLIDERPIVSLARNHREVRHILTPLNLYSAIWAYGNDRYETTPEFLPVATDAEHDPHVGKPKVHVLVVGETARAANFSLGGYPRQTNPRLAQLPVVYFPAVSTCGTATSVSLPCMFAVEGRDNFDREAAKYQENLLDVAARSGYEVYWRDNGNSCKSVCARADSRDLGDSGTSIDCEADAVDCYDERLVAELATLLESVKTDTLIVLHQLGSHGPAYYRRYPERFRQFTPDCRSADLSDCSTTEIVNAYDNTILYTDYVVAELIKTLEDRGDQFDTSLLYVSDHGESLGEHSLFLHGMPYFLAPAEQTEVPMLYWSASAARSLAATGPHECGPAGPQLSPSHDNLFHTELGILDIATTAYDAELDVLAGCDTRPLATASQPAFLPGT